MSKVEALFKSLDEIIHNSDVDYDKAIDTCDKILQEQPNDKEATQVKVISLIQQNKFDEALKTITNTSAANKSELVFEQAYCEYKNRQHSECLKLLSSIPEPKPVRVLHLIAQAHYRLENWDECLKIYNVLEKQDPTNELKANTIASFASSRKSAEGFAAVAKNTGLIKESFEYAYNAACLAIVDNNYTKALEFLEQSIATCKSNSDSEGLSKEETDDELAIILTQLGLVKQKLKLDDEAAELYNTVLKNKPSDQAVTAVASNNVVTLQKDQSFDSEKKLKHAEEFAENKLAEWQKKIIAFNRCLLQLKLKKMKEFKEMMQELQKKYPESSYPVLLSASAFIREKKYSEAQTALEEYVKKNKDVQVQLCLAQLKLISGNIAGAIDGLNSIESLRYKPSMVAAIVTLQEQIGQLTAASAYFSESIKYWEGRKSQLKDTHSESIYLRLAQEAAAFNLKHKLYSQAAVLYEVLVKQYPKNTTLLAKYIIALAYVDPAASEKLVEKLGYSEEKVDAEALENLPIYGRKVTEAAPTTTADKQQQTATVIVKKNKKDKKKKKKIPKNIDPNEKPDPERWLPKHERSYYKRRKRRDEPIRLRGSAQGAVDKSAPLEIAELLPKAAKPKAASDAKAAAPSKTTPKQEPKPATPQKPQGKKKGGRRR